MTATASLVLTESVSQEAQSSCRVLSGRSHPCEPSPFFLEVAVRIYILLWGARLLEPSLPETAVGALHPASRALRTQAMTLLGMPSCKANRGGQVTSVLYFSVVLSRNLGTPVVFLSLLVRSSALAVAQTQFRCNY